MKRKKETSTTLVRKEDAKQKWYVFDAAGKTLGRFCSEIAKVLRGKHKTDFTPYIDNGDGVIVINAEKIEVSGAKEAQKIYRSYTGFIGGLREVAYRTMKEKKPEMIIERAVKGMMPKSRLGKQQLRKLRIFKGEKHTFEAQKPIRVDI
ncbi:MAG: 50S ribosomal protein L13 [Chlamydiales bacterium]|nr:50S ribosomal protein L13 [Chlamydiales bacterium]MCH9620121.1 50S ribosomal protein L13 [Chlamydiales bacterium]MCH9623591.1 50S ribosomal protein L13 [Chlamydiales bacterium]